MDILTIDCGTLGTWTAQIIDAETGLPTEGYSDSTPLEAVLWSGDDQAPVSPAPVAEWADAALGLATVRIPGAVTAGLEPGLYRLRVAVVDQGEVLPAWEAALQVRSSPGEAEPLPVYCSGGDLLNHAPWLAELQDLPSAQAGFREQRAAARAWLDELVLARWRGCRQYLEGLLAADGLVVTARIRELVARKAVAMVCESQIGPGKDSPYVALAGRYHAQASSMAACLVVEVGPVRLNLSAFNVLRG